MIGEFKLPACKHTLPFTGVITVNATTAYVCSFCERDALIAEVERLRAGQCSDLSPCEAWAYWQSEAIRHVDEKMTLRATCDRLTAENEAMGKAAFIAGYDAGWNASGEGHDAEWQSKGFTAEKYKAAQTAALDAFRSTTARGK